MELVEKVVKETTYIVELSQTDMNTIAVALAKTNDNIIKSHAEEYGIKKYHTGNKLVNLYEQFEIHSI